MSSLVEFVATAQAEKARQVATRYAELIQSVADGMEVDPAEALIIVEAAGKTAADCDAAIARLQRIKTLESIIATEPEVRRQRQETDERLTTEVKEAKAALDAAQQRYDTAFREYNAFIRWPTAGLEQIADARRELRQLTGPPASAQPVQVQPISSHIDFGQGPTPPASVQAATPRNPFAFSGSTYQDAAPAAEPMIGLKSGEG